MKQLKNRTKEIAKTATVEFLDVILGLAESMATICAGRKEVYKALNGYGTREWTVENICRSLHSLKQRNYIEIKNENGQESIRYTNKAKLKMLDKISERSTNDGVMRFISFDIPEKLKTERDKFRRAIKNLGFRQIQKSLWVINKDVGSLVELAALEYGVNDYVVYILAAGTNIDSTITAILNKRGNE